MNDQTAYMFVKTSLGHSEFVVKYHGRFLLPLQYQIWFKIRSALVWYVYDTPFLEVSIIHREIDMYKWDAE